MSVLLFSKRASSCSCSTLSVESLKLPLLKEIGSFLTLVRTWKFLQALLGSEAGGGGVPTRPPLLSSKFSFSSLAQISLSTNEGGVFRDMALVLTRTVVILLIISSRVG